MDLDDAPQGRSPQQAQFTGTHARESLPPTRRRSYLPPKKRGFTPAATAADISKGYSLEPIISKLADAPAPIVVADWSGETQPFVPLFISPGRSAETAAKAAAPKSEKRARGSNNTVEYSMILSGTQRRPKTRMPIEGHKAVGRLLKSVLVGTRQRAGVYGRVDAIRYELDNWVQCEYKRDELSDEIFHDLYYRELPKDDPLATPLSSRDRHIATLAEVEARLARYYPECPPLRALLKKADLAIASLRAWN